MSAAPIPFHRGADTGLPECVKGANYYPFGLQMPGRVYVAEVPAREGFTGHELDPETGHYYAGARYYMPALGRWTSMDPLAEEFPSVSPYNYALNNPISLFDPDGMAPACDPPQSCPGYILQQGRALWNRATAPLQDWFGGSREEAAAITARRAPVAMKVVDEGARVVLEPYDYVRTGIDLGVDAYNGNLTVASAGAQIGAALTPFLSGGLGRLGVKLATRVDNAGNFASGAMLRDHFERHGSEFGGVFRNAEEYARGAQNFFRREGDGMFQYTRSNGDIVKYDSNNNIFGVVAADGTIRTFFKPEDGAQYYERQARRDLQD